MNWIDVLWPMVTGTCLTLALINLRRGFAGPMRAAHLFFSLNAFAVAFISGVDGLVLFWGDLETWIVPASLTGFFGSFSAPEAGGLLWPALAFMPWRSRLASFEVRVWPIWKSQVLKR